MGIVEQGERLKLLEAGGDFAGFEQPWAGHGDDTLFHQQFAVQARADVGLAIADCEIHAVGIEVGQPICGQYT
ncbi:hypothetical protein D3C78_1555660 [compost metagenome]